MHLLSGIEASVFHTAKGICASLAAVLLELYLHAHETTEVVVELVAELPAVPGVNQAYIQTVFRYINAQNKRGLVNI
ncbi:hypothetical protein ACFSKU_08855 [Pontibacter silvestris]|uniref:Uncharacterized protein n=1 Tax=Pontibacter silvestris TaxID=2305183 RepID=A0ABW4WXL8_9BACT|nr:hypothetical protein [Pontibacter silvestris]MCC9138933.1 hypothetical protein [Pontibacter silvestris]